MEKRIEKVRRIAGEILSQMMNVPTLSGLLATVFYLRLSVDEPNRFKGYLLALVFVSAVPLLSLLFYIPVKAEPHEKTVHRQRLASFTLMGVNFPIGCAVLSSLPAPAIFTATGAAAIDDRGMPGGEGPSLLAEGTGRGAFHYGFMPLSGKIR